MNGRAGRVARVALVAVGILAPLALHWLTGRTLAWFDTQRLYAPQRWLVDEAIRAFRLPLWNPFMGGGMPLLADTIHGVLHPVSVAVAWLGTGRSADLLIGGYALCAGLGAALLARDLGATRIGAALAAFAYALSGFVLSMAGNLVFLAGAGSLPFCVAGLRRFAAEPRPGSLLFGAAATAILGFSGDAQALMVGGGLALALSWEAGGWRGALRAVAAGSVGLLLAGVQLLPSALHVPRTDRAAETWGATPWVWAFEPWRLPELLLPGLLSGADAYADPVYAALAGPGHWPVVEYPMPFAGSVFMGLVPVALAGVGLIEGRRGKLLGLLALLFLWGALGPVLGADAILGQLPVWRAFRHAEKLVGPLTLVLSLLAARGFDAVVERRVAGGRFILGALALAVLAVGASWLRLRGLPHDAAGLAESRLLRAGAHLLAALLALGGWLAVRSRAAMAGTAGTLALAAIGWCSLAAGTFAALRPGDAEARLRAPGPQLAAPPPGPRIVTPYFHDLVADDPSVDSGDLAAREHASLGYPAYNVRAGIDSLNVYAAMNPTRLAAVAANAWLHWPLAPRRFGVTHLVLDRPATPSDLALYAQVTGEGARLESRTVGHELWSLPHREWASFAPSVRWEADERAAFAEAARTFAGQDPTVVVEAASALGAAPGRVVAVERGRDRLRIEAEAAGEGTLVVNDAWWPGWEATLDGSATPVFRADGWVRAVRWPPGRHVLEMRYRPPEVRGGLLLSALGMVLLSAGFLFLRRAARRPSGSPV